ncbi:SusC/RagA family TonB-linked outer membrane protein [Flavobacterium amniphilum]|uniref:SusC/RagA family TonB-linked outer membrane protein n=1 Tax=Flavobacterium amniphilum TaxID=1834035 RepID=UPI00202A41DB|nr:SusC/RagA family TonB-linked outer membrane protein [Flavobacterium amniphilum]MCL9805189.1 SusC/RagA family TonB-linked outer membrane protein [Flavobacterium amniphilum]
MKSKFKWMIALFVALFVQMAFAQEKTISGVVSDNAGPLPGVNVVVKGTTKGVQTNFDGSYTIKAQESEVLVFSFMGMVDISRTIGASNTINVVMREDAKVLNEVVVTALGVGREKKSLGYGTQKIDGSEVSKGPTSNFINGLSGKVAGLQIKNNNNMGGSTNVVIRGFKSISSNNQALFVIDGVPVDNSNTNTNLQQTGTIGYDYGNAAADINPNDIESINVLKGAAATALYGSRAANGAIMITTKKGKNSQKGIGITLDSGVSIGKVDKSTFASYQTKYGQGYAPSFRTAFDVDGDGVNDLVVRTNHDASYGPAYDSNLMVYGWDSFIPESPYYKTARPWEIAKNGAITFFKSPVATTNTLSLNGANEKGSFALSYTNMISTGLLPNSKQDKNSFIGNASLKLNDKITANFMGNYIYTKTLGRNGTGYLGNIVSNFRQWWATNADIKELEDIYTKHKQNYTWNANNPNNTSPAYWNNPYFDRFENYQNDSRNRFIGNTSLSYKFNDWLDAMGRISVDTYGQIQEERRAYGSYAGDPFGISQTNDPAGYQRFNRNYTEFNYDLMLNFNKNLTPDLNLKGIAGISLRRQHISSILASTSGGLIVPGIYSLSNSLNPVEKPVEFEAKQGVNGYYVSASLGYKDTYYVDATMRRDVASTLPVNNNEYYYPSVSSSILFSNLVKQDWLDLGKLRLGYAEVGNDARFAILKDTYVSVTPFTSPLFSVPNVKNNPNLKPERTKSWEAGLEMQFFKKRFGFDLSAYKTNTINQIVNIPVSESTGVTQVFKNVGKIENKGLEAIVNITPVVNDNFKWDVAVNWSMNRNKVLELDEGIENYQLGQFQGGISINASIGKPYGTIQGTDYVYLNGQRVVDATTGKYLISPTNDNVIGNFTPDWNGGINNKFSYGNLSFSFLVDMQKGGDVFSLDRWYGEGTGLYGNTVFTNDLGNPVRNSLADGGGVILPGVFADGTPNDIRIDTSTGTDGYFGYLGSANSDYVYDASYIKLREVTLGYSLPKKFLGDKIQDVYFGVTGSNLWIIHKNLPDADPESGLSSGNLQGFQSGVLPTTRNIAFNLKVKF